MCVKLRVLFPPDYSAPGSGAVNDASGNPYWEVLIKPAHKMLGYIGKLCSEKVSKISKGDPLVFEGEKHLLMDFIKENSL